MDEPFARGNSPIHAMDPAARIAAAVVVSFCAALCLEEKALAGHLCLGLLLTALARLPLARVLARLKPLFGFLVMIWIIMPLTYAGVETIPVGPISLSREGMALCRIITLKSLGILLYFMALAATMETATLGHALQRLRVPDKMVFLLLMTYRYVSVMQAEYQRLHRAASFRGFVPDTSIHTYRTIAYLAGMLFVRAAWRASRVYNAMRCRGFNGRFHTLDTYEFHLKDHLILLLAVLTALGLNMGSCFI